MSNGASRVRMSGSTIGAWQLAEADPAPDLCALVHGYTGFVERSVGPLRRREFPSGTVTVIINLGAPLAVSVPGGAPTLDSGSFVAPISDLPAVTEFSGVSSGVQIDLTPLGAHMLLDLPMDELPGPVARLDELLGREASLLVERLALADGWEARFDLLDAFITRRLALARPPAPSVEWAWRAMLASGGRIEIGTLSDRLGCSRRHLIAGFRSQVGVTPKTAAAIIRFQRAGALLRGERELALAAVAQACGYHDQSHMTRDFRRFAMTTPRRYRGAWREDRPGVPEEQVNSVQDPRAPAS